MDDESVTNGEVFDDAEIGGDEGYDAESKTSALSAKIDAVEQENSQLIHENEIIKERVEKLKQSVEDSSNEKSELQKKLVESEFERKALESVTARASELEDEANQLSNNLTKALNDLEESSSEVSLLKSTLVGLESSENDKKIKTQAIIEEKNLLISRVEELEASANEKIAEKEAKEQEIIALENKVMDLEASVLTNKDWDEEKVKHETAKKELEVRTKEMKQKVSELQNKLKDMEQEDADAEVNCIPAVAVEKNGSNFGGTFEWALVAGSLFIALATGVVIYLGKARRT